MSEIKKHLFAFLFFEPAFNIYWLWWMAPFYNPEISFTRPLFWFLLSFASFYNLSVSQIFWNWCCPVHVMPLWTEWARTTRSFDKKKHHNLEVGVIVIQVTSFFCLEPSKGIGCISCILNTCLQDHVRIAYVTQDLTSENSC